MKHKNVELNIRSTPAESRSEIRASSFAKIRRTYDHYSHGSDRKKKRKSRGNEKFRMYLRLILAGVAIFFLIASARLIYALVTENPKASTFVNVEEQQRQVSAPHPNMAACLELVKAVHAAKSADELRGFVVLRRLSPERAFDLLTQWKSDAGEVDAMNWQGELESNRLSMEMVTVRYKKGKKTTACIRLDSSNVWGVDLESMLQYSSEPPEKLLSKDDLSAIVRVLISPDFYYNGEFADSQKWKSVSMLLPGNYEKIQGYVKLDSPSYLALKELMRDRKAASVLLEISRRKSMLPRQYEIKSVIAAGWVESDVVFSDEFQSAVQPDNN